MKKSIEMKDLVGLSKMKHIDIFIILEWEEWAYADHNVTIFQA